MSYPTEIDFGQILLGNGATPTEVFTVVCGIENGSLNETVNTNDVFRRDCAKPGQVPTRKVKATGRQWDVTGNGVANTDEFTRLAAALGISKNYKIIVGKRDGTDAGTILGTFSGPMVLTAKNINFDAQSGTMEITAAGENTPIWTPA